MIDNNNIVEKAIAFASEACQGKKVQPSGTPLILHPMEAVIIMSELDHDDITMMAVSALHRITDFTETTFDDIEAAFGSRIKGLLVKADISAPEEAPSEEIWMAAKEEEIAALKKLPFKLKMIILADKIAELRSLSRDYEVFRADLWNRLPQKNPKLLAKYYFSMGDVFYEFEEYPAFGEYNRLAAKLFVAYR